MKYNSKIGLGTVQYGLNYGISNRIGQTTINDVKEIFMFAKQNRIDLFDTANSYGDSEYVLGQIGIENFNVVTKFNAITTFECLDQFNASLYNLKVDRVYGLLSHSVSHLKDGRCVWDVMEELKKKKKVLKIGFSFNNESDIDIVLNSGVIPDLIQIPYNILDNRFISIAKYFKSKGTEIHSRSTFLQGLFFCELNQLSDHFNIVKPFIRTIQEQSENLASDLLFYCLKNEVIDKIIIGVNNLKQLNNILSNLDNAKSLKIEVPRLDEKILSPSNWKMT